MDWFLLTRSRWLAGICRQNENQESCLSKGARAGNHQVHVPGRSYYGWALAASGLKPAARGDVDGSCPCGVDSGRVSVLPRAGVTTVAAVTAARSVEPFHPPRGEKVAASTTNDSSVCVFTSRPPTPRRRRT